MVAWVTVRIFLLLEAFILNTTRAIDSLNMTDVTVSFIVPAKYAPERAIDGDWETFAETVPDVNPAIIFEFPESVLITHISFVMNLSSSFFLSSVQCDFEDPSICGFVQDSSDEFDWTRASGSTSSSNTGPSFDRTYTNQGYYMYIETSSPRILDEVARLWTPSYLATNDMCIEWFYHMYGSTVNTLNVYMVKANGTVDVPAWSKANEQGNQWIPAQVATSEPGTYQIMFEGIVGSGVRGDIAIDDVRITDRACTPSLVQCDFEDQSICSFVQDSSDDFEWTRASGTTPSIATGPSFDHTHGNQTGYYMYIETSSPRILDEVARLRTPPYLATHGQCIEWFYHMYGSTMNTLNVYVVDNTDNVSTLVWTKTNNQGNEWIFGQVSVATSGTFHTVFEGIAGGSYTGDIGLDDVSITDGVCLAKLRVGSSVNIKENTFCGNITVGSNNNEYTSKTSCVGKYLSFQVDCANCSLQFHELVLHAYTDTRPIEYEGYYRNGNCHMIFNETVDWLSARTKCEAEGESGHLVTIDSEEENSFVFEIIRHEGVLSTWIGLKKENSSIQWVDGEGSTFSNLNEENSEDAEDCVSMGNDESPKWNWKNCANFKTAYICQKPASNRGIDYKKYNSQKRITADRTAKKYDGVTSSGSCSLYCMSYTGCISFSFSLLTNECRLSDTIEINLADDLYANYFVQNHLFEKCNF
ncbi:MAM and LDL-receptor class A domain-containing protein 1-like [Anneissia japonica]|uniref:MAM and LDL-receptor class A domain-containing protein 1-like n=1 Tax=Anneissia japonica TaxID=1529436 RepID=UPI001425617A|nr:MAM and LDL-receptor class A domain-containing protein 1-like [Anneissia japonica]